METTPHTHARRRRRFGVAVSVLAAASLAVGVATASAHQAGSHKRVVATMSPTTPVAGKQFTITFSVVSRGVALPITNVGCLGMTNRKPIPVVTTNNGTSATCTWNLPSKVGPTFDGMLVAYNGGTPFYLGYDLPIS